MKVHKRREVCQSRCNACGWNGNGKEKKVHEGERVKER